MFELFNSNDSKLPIDGLNFLIYPLSPYHTFPKYLNGNSECILEAVKQTLSNQVPDWVDPRILEMKAQLTEEGYF